MTNDGSTDRPLPIREQQFNYARDAYEQGRVDAAEYPFLLVANDETWRPDQRASAAFYLGSLYHHQHRFDRARECYELAAELGTGPEREWALDALAGPG